MKRAHLLSLGIASIATWSLVACSTSSNDVFATGGSGGSLATTTGTSAGTSQGGSTADGQTSTGAFMTGSTGTGGTTCTSGPNEDKDMDGWTVEQGDCNDCDPNVNPGAIEVKVTTPDPMTMMIPPPADEDCDGMIDNVPMPCDAGLAVDSASAMDGAKAIELCHVANGAKDWGVISADYVNANGSGFSNNAAQHGLLANFGPNVPPKGGQTVLAISSGRARLPGQPGVCTSQTCTSNAGTPPPNFPAAVPGCAGGTNINDDVALQVQLRAPSNAKGYKFAFKFASWEFPEWVCTTYNDQFIALVNPAPMGADPGGNISFDSNHNPVSVNIAFFDVCDSSLCANFAQFCNPAVSTCPGGPPANCCAQGPAQLQGTGFDNSAYGNAGGTAWLETQAPIKGGDTFTIRFAIWDTGDHALDSTAVVDNFEWIAQGGTVTVGTTPIPN
jgi:hypothetical protein